MKWPNKQQEQRQIKSNELVKLTNSWHSIFTFFKKKIYGFLIQETMCLDVLLMFIGITHFISLRDIRLFLMNRRHQSLPKE